MPEDCIHGVDPQSQPFALHQFRSNAYNYNVTVSGIIPCWKKSWQEDKIS